jgi:hypothetical protein
VTALRRTASVGAATMVAVGLTGCHLATKTRVVNEPTIVTTVTSTASPKPIKTIFRDYRTYRAGQTGQLGSRSQKSSLLIRAGKPSTSTTRLSSGYGLDPQNGHYVTFPLTIRNAGRVPVLIQRLDFYVKTPGVPDTTTDEGNSPVSGSPQQLDTTELAPGQQVSNNLTFDLAHTSGILFYAPHGERALAWRF